MHFPRFLRSLLRPLLAATFLIAASGGAMAADTGFTTLATPQRADTGKKVEVVEFFMYSCPHCNALDPLMHDWVKKQGDKIAFRRVHLAFSGPKDPQAHAYATLETMGVLEQYHDKIFRIQAKLKRNEQLINAAKIDSAPTIVIDGRFVTSPAQLSRPGQNERQTQEATLRVMDELVARVLKERGATPAAAPAKK